MAAAMKPRTPLDDPALALFAWARFRRLMRLMLSVAVAVVLLAAIRVYRHGADVRVDGVIATALGIALAMLAASAIMGLAFLRRLRAAELPEVTPDKAGIPQPERRQSDVPE